MNVQDLFLKNTRGYFKCQSRAPNCDTWPVNEELYDNCTLHHDETNTALLDAQKPSANVVALTQLVK